MPGVEDIIEQSDETATDPEKADLSKMPFSTSRKLFFSMAGQDYVASANLMESQNLLLTAAHCVQDNKTGSLGENFLFERCYDSGKASEKLTFKTVALKEYWYSEKKWKWDYSIGKRLVWNAFLLDDIIDRNERALCQAAIRLHGCLQRALLLCISPQVNICTMIKFTIVTISHIPYTVDPDTPYLVPLFQYPSAVRPVSD